LIEFGEADPRMRRAGSKASRPAVYGASFAHLNGDASYMLPSIVPWSGTRCCCGLASKSIRISLRPHGERRRQAVDDASGHNKAAIAIANKLARVIWAVWHRDVDFDPQAPCRAVA
jgi:hypothetical protein